MKKILSGLFFTASLFSFASIASATNADITTITTLTFKPSANVLVFYGTDTSKQNYVLNSKHKAGDRTYSSSNNTSAVWYNTAIAAGTALTAAGGITNPGESTYSNWSSQ